MKILFINFKCILLKKIIEPLYIKVFEWIFKCEKKFSHLNLSGYGKERLYDFLAERYFSFYFEKYTKIKVWPWYFIDDFGRAR